MVRRAKRGAAEGLSAVRSAAKETPVGAIINALNELLRGKGDLRDEDPQAVDAPPNAPLCRIEG